MYVCMRENKSVIARGLTEIIEELITKRLMGIRVIENFYPPEYGK